MRQGTAWWAASGLLVAIAIGADLMLSPEQPAERIVGANEPPPPPLPPIEAGIDPAALAEAAAYAQRQGSRALLVNRNAHLVYEHYWEDSSFATVADAQSLATCLPALLVGTALSERTIGDLDEPVANYLESWRTGEERGVTIRLLLTEAGRHERALMELIAAATRRSYGEYLSEKLWKPLGAADATMRSDGGCCFRARQGDWIRLGEALLADGLYQASEVIPRGWARLALARGAQRGGDTQVARDLFTIGGADGHRLWVVPSRRLAILRIARPGGSGAHWDDARIPDLVIGGLRDVVPHSASGSKVDPSLYVPGH